jgi:class 3 adenylate cyclase/pimeloyl-ACP methyl ester carboxylesterase
MEPRIQYAKTSDGVNIAYAVFGDGPPIVYVGGPFGELDLYTQLSEYGDLLAIEALVQRGYRFIAYDGRGTGSSDRIDADCSLEGRLRDLEAVLERAGLERFALAGRGQGGPVAIAYGIKQPGCVTHLLLAATYANGADWYKLVPVMRATRAADAMAEEQWEYYTLGLANAATGFRHSDVAERLAAVMRDDISAKIYLSYRDTAEKIDVTDLLPFVTVPTLVVHSPGLPLSNLDLLRVLASRIPNARLVSLTATGPLAAPADVASAIDAFMREGEQPAAAAPDLPSGMTAILFADIADSTALTESLGDAAFRAKARDLDAALRTVIREHAGTPIEGKLLGDGVLAVFTSARQAIEAALACAKAGAEASLPLHLGLHAGDVIREDNNVYGGAVNIASRISGLSAPGEVLVSETVRALARTSAGVTFEDKGRRKLKGSQDVLRIWAVREG